MNKKVITDLEVTSKRVIVRVDFNVPMSKTEEGKITDNARIVAALPTIKYLIENNARIILLSHLGRPKGEAKKEFSLAPVAKELSKLLNKDEDINLKALYGSKCSINTIKNIQIVEDSLKNNQITIYDMKDFYEKCYQVRNFENKEVQWTFRLKLDDGKGNLLKTTYIDVFFIGKTPERIVVVCKDIVIEQDYILNLEVGNVAESLSEQWKEIYEL